MKSSVYNLRKQGFKTHQERAQQRQEALAAQRQVFLGTPAPIAEPVAMPPVRPAEPSALSSSEFRALETLRTAEVWYTATGRGTSRFNQWMEDQLNRFVPVKEPVVAKHNGIYEDKFPAKDGWNVHIPNWLSKDMHCCGVKEHHGIQNQIVLTRTDPKDPDWVAERKVVSVSPTDYIIWAKEQQKRYGRHRPYYLFTEATPTGTHKQGDRIVKYIEEHKLGDVAVHGPLTNDNSGNKVTLFVWMVDNKALVRHKPVFEVDTAKKTA
jgi:hypothetical protein